MQMYSKLSHSPEPKWITYCKKRHITTYPEFMQFKIKNMKPGDINKGNLKIYRELRDNPYYISKKKYGHNSWFENWTKLIYGPKIVTWLKGLYKIKLDYNDLSTFADLFNYFKSYHISPENKNVKEWFSNNFWDKDEQSTKHKSGQWEKLESAFRLFAALGLFPQLIEFTYCTGNFNTGTLIKARDISEFFQKDGVNVKLKDIGDKSDYSGFNEDESYLLITTSKSLCSDGVNEYDIRDIKSLHYDNYPDKELVLCIVTRDKHETKRKRDNANSTSKDIVDIMNRTSTIYIDKEDITMAFVSFIKIYGEKTLSSIFKSCLKPLIFRMHQKIGVKKTIRLVNEGVQDILWGHIQRSGKSYIIAGTIIEHSKGKSECNYLVMSLAPNETKRQQYNVLQCSQLEDFNVVVLDRKNKQNGPKGKKNIIICSEQFLKLKLSDDNAIEWLKNMKIEITFVDESHYGGTTNIAKETLDTYTKKSVKIQITATYDKPTHSYNIPPHNQVLWSLHDIRLCKTGEKAELLEKHGIDGKDIIDSYSEEQIQKEYEKIPTIEILSDNIKEDISEKIRIKTEDNNYGWSLHSCMLLVGEGTKNTECTFQKPECVRDVLYRIFGKQDELGIPDDNYPNPLMGRYKNICRERNMRVMGEGIMKDNPLIIMMFIPPTNIHKRSIALKEMIEKEYPDKYDCVCLNSKKTKNPRKTIEDQRINTKNKMGKIGNKTKAIVVISNKQCGLAASIDFCDITILMHDSKNLDMCFQMMMRALTEGENKNTGFIFDMSNTRPINILMDYASKLNPHEKPDKVIRYLLESKCLRLNSDMWESYYGEIKPYTLNAYVQHLYNTYHSNIVDSIKYELNKLRINRIPLDEKDDTTLNHMTNPRAKMIVTHKNNYIKKGIEKKRINENNTDGDIGGASKDEEDVIEENKRVNINDITLLLIPIMCILTIHEDDNRCFMDLLNFIRHENNLNTCLHAYTDKVWGHNFDIDKLIIIYNNINTQNNMNINTITRNIKKLFKDSNKVTKTMSKLIDKYIITQHTEKKKYAEVPTPFNLRQDMLIQLDKINFWSSKQRVFESCVGKYGFSLDIIDKFMTGLSDKIPDETERYRFIVEECLYFSDINATNIFICKLLIDPNNEYKLNYNIGNTLELDITKDTEHWKGIDKFDAVIGNPPYNSSCGNKGKGNTLWDKFVVKSINNWLNPNGYLLFVHPRGWRQYANKIGKLMLSKQILYLNMNNVKMGQKTFKCSTDFDYYLLKNIKPYTTTLINDYKNIEIEYDLKNTKFIPNHSIDMVDKHMDISETNGLIKDRSLYGTERKWVQKTQTHEFKHPCVYTINKNNEVTFRYSNINNNGHFGVTKFIISNGCGHLKDIEGKYGCTEWAYYIKCDREDMDDIEKCFQNQDFLNIIDAVQITSNKYNYVILKYLKHKFWKEFL
jgi:hypothetical protein